MEERVILQELMLDARRSIRNLSTVSGLRALASFRWSCCDAGARSWRTSREPIWCRRTVAEDTGPIPAAILFHRISQRMVVSRKNTMYPRRGGSAKANRRDRRGAEPEGGPMATTLSRRARRCGLFLACSTIVALQSPPASAQVREPQEPGTGLPEMPPALPEKPPAKYDFQHNITGDWFGLRNTLSDEGVEISGGYATGVPRQSGGRQEPGIHLRPQHPSAGRLQPGEADRAAEIGVPRPLLAALRRQPDQRSYRQHLQRAAIVRRRPDLPAGRGADDPLAVRRSPEPGRTAGSPRPTIS